MSVSENDILDAIEKYGRESPKHPTGKGWETIAHMAKRAKKGISALRYQLKLAISKGLKVERFVGSDYDDTGALRRQTWFRVKP